MKRKKKRRSFFGRRKDRVSPKLERDLDQAVELIEQGQFEEVIDLLTPWAEQGARHVVLYSFLGLAYMELGNLFAAIDALEKAVDIERQPELVGMLLSLYTLTENQVLALSLYERLKGWERDSLPDEIHADIRQWKENIKTIAEQRRIPYEKAKKGLLAFHRGRILLGQGKFEASIPYAQEALRYLGDDYLPALNNLAIAYYLTGAWQQAIETSYRVLEEDPDNIFALSNLVRFLTWTDQEEKAKALWERLQPIAPENDEARLKKAEAAAVMEDDETVYHLLYPVMDTLELTPELIDRATFFMAVAAANLGKRREAMGWFRELADFMPRAQFFLDLLKERRAGPGFMDRYPYFIPSEVIPRQSLETLIEFLDVDHAKSQMQDFTQQFPGIYVVLKQLLAELEGPDEVLLLLDEIGTPEAHAILKDFALGDKGHEEQRRFALDLLVQAGVFSEGEKVPFWQDGEWIELEIHKSLRPDNDPEILTQIEEAFYALQEERLDDAQVILQHILEENPEVKDAIHILAIVHLGKGQLEESKALLERALAIDPDYVFARCNLARIYLLSHQLDKAEAIIQPLREKPESSFSPAEFAIWTEVQALIAIEKGDYIKAKTLLEQGLRVLPNYFPNQELLDRLNAVDATGMGLETLTKLNQRLREEHRAYRLRQQHKLREPNPTIQQALGIYTKDQMKAMARILAPEGGWSTLKKQALWDLLVKKLQDPQVLKRLVEDLSQKERQALLAVLDAGGRMDWDAFNDRFGNDLEESPHWEFQEPESIMGRLRIRGLIVEATDGEQLWIVIPQELRAPLRELLRSS